MVKLLNVSELSTILNIKKKTIYDWTHRGMIPYVKLGGCLRFDSEAIEKWVKTNAHAMRIRGNHVFNA